MRLDSFFSGALCVLSGGRLPEALFMVFLLDSQGAEVFLLDSKRAEVDSFFSRARHVPRPEDACPKRFSWFFYWIQ